MEAYIPYVVIIVVDTTRLGNAWKSVKAVQTADGTADRSGVSQVLGRLGSTLQAGPEHKTWIKRSTVVLEPSVPNKPTVSVDVKQYSTNH